MRLGGGRRDDWSVFSPPSGLTVSVLTSLLAFRPKNIVVVVVNVKTDFSNPSFIKGTRW